MNTYLHRFSGIVALVILNAFPEQSTIPVDRTEEAILHIETTSATGFVLAKSGDLSESAISYNHSVNNRSSATGIAILQEENPPSCTNLLGPPDGTTNVGVGASLHWGVAAGASGYKLYVGTSSGGTDLVNAQDVSSNTFQFPENLPAFTKIYVRIVPYNSSGSAAGCTEESFTTGSAPQPPECTTLTNPGPGSTNAFITATISWERIDSATGYLISMGLDPEATSYVQNRNVGNSDTFFLGEALPYDTDIYVKVTPYNSSGEAQDCSIQTFRTRKDPNEPASFECTELKSPQNGATAVSTTTLLTWDPVPEVVSYLLTVGTSSGGDEILNLVNVGNSTSFEFINELPENTRIYVTVTPGYGSGTASDCPETSFTTGTKSKPTGPKAKSRYGISPDDDGINEFWEIEDLDRYTNNTVQIFNRWGDLVFETTNYDNTQNVFRGVANRKTTTGAGNLPEGTYFFRITSENPEIMEPATGFIVLKR